MVIVIYVKVCFTSLRLEYSIFPNPAFEPFCLALITPDSRRRSCEPLYHPLDGLLVYSEIPTTLTARFEFESNFDQPLHHPVGRSDK